MKVINGKKFTGTKVWESIPITKMTIVGLKIVAICSPAYYSHITTNYFILEIIFPSIFIE